MNIYEINKDLEAILASQVDETTGEVSEQGMAEYEALSLSKQEKQKNTIMYYKNIIGTVDVLDAEMQRLSKLKQIYNNKADRIKNLIEYGMGDDEAIDFGICGAKFKKNPPSVIIDDEALIPKAYIKEKVVTSIDKAALRKDIQEGDQIEGAHIEQGTRLTIY